MAWKNRVSSERKSVMKTLKLERYGKDHQVCFSTARYYNNNLCVKILECETNGIVLWSYLTVNFDIRCPEHCAFIDVNNNGDRIVEWVITHGLGHLTGRICESGFCTYPEVVFNMEKLEEYML